MVAVFADVDNADNADVVNPVHARILQLINNINSIDDTVQKLKDITEIYTLFQTDDGKQILFPEFKQTVIQKAHYFLGKQSEHQQEKDALDNVLNEFLNNC